MSRSTLTMYMATWACTLMLAASARAADSTSTYIDLSRAESGSYAHSLFWDKDMTPLPEPYMCYLDIDGGGLAFVDYQERLAELCYEFSLPSWQTQRVVTGVIEVDVSFPSNTYMSQFYAGQLSCQMSPNGMTWSNGIWLGGGRYQFNVACPEGTCYVRFAGTRAMINSLSLSLNSPAATIRVPQDYGTIQAAINAATDFDIIEVARGTYSGPIDFLGKSVTVRSSDGAQSTTINCTGTTHGVYLHGGNPTLAGFTIKGGRVSAEVPPSLPPSKTGSALTIGGGIYCESGSPTIANCIITDCTAGIGGGICIAQAQPSIVGCAINNCTAVRGGGIGLLAGSNATIIDCTVESNRGTGAGLGGGFYCLDSDATFSGCRIANNTTGNVTGGGAYCTGWSSDVTFQNSLIVGNSANTGPGLYAEQCGVTLSNCTIAQNRLTSGGSGGGVRSSNASVSITNSIIWANGGTPITGSGISVNYSDVDGGSSGTGNINQDPLFVSTTDFHLQSKVGRYNSQTGLWTTSSGTSPGIDAGNPSSSWVVEPIPNGGRVNMGAYGGSPQASKGTSRTIYHVAVGGSDTYSGLSKDQPLATIKRAVSKAQSGDVILVWPGTYVLNTKTDEIVFGGKAIRIQSAADPAIISARDGYAFSFYTGEGSNSILSNLVIQGCGTGAIFCSGASPTLKNLTIVGNPTGVYAVENADPYIVNCIFWANANTDLFLCNASYSLWNKKLNGLGAVTDPLFADAANGDYHLKSKYGRYLPSSGMWVFDTVSSPCIDGGDPCDYPQAETMPHGNRINMGAQGNTPYASRSSWPPY